MISIIKITASTINRTFDVIFSCDGKNKKLANKVIEDLIQCQFCTSLTLKLPKMVFDGGRYEVKVKSNEKRSLRAVVIALNK